MDGFLPKAEKPSASCDRPRQAAEIADDLSRRNHGVRRREWPGVAWAFLSGNETASAIAAAECPLLHRRPLDVVRVANAAIVAMDSMSCTARRRSMSATISRIVKTATIAW